MRCTIYKTDKAPGCYLYLADSHQWQQLPTALTERFTPPTKVMDIDITASTGLARADVAQVLNAFDIQGFYLQMPPADRAINRTIDHTSNPPI